MQVSAAEFLGLAVRGRAFRPWPDFVIFVKCPRRGTGRARLLDDLEQIFRDPMTAMAAVDRWIQNSIILHFDGDCIYGCFLSSAISGGTVGASLARLRFA